MGSDAEVPAMDGPLMESVSATSVAKPERSAAVCLHVVLGARTGTGPGPGSRGFTSILVARRK
jgi:hypothetical protein